MPGRVQENQNPRSNENINLEIPGFPIGVNNRSPETSIPSGAAREIVNADVYKEGNVQRRTGYTLVESVSQAHSLWTCPEIDYALFVDGGTIKQLDQYGEVTSLSTSVSPVARMSWCWHNDIIYYSNGFDLGRIVNGSVTTWGLPVPASPTLSTTTGSLYAGEYCVTLVNISPDGEESGAPMASTITVSDNSAITVSTTAWSGISHVDIYTTDVNGDIFYLAARVTAGDSYTIDQGIRGKQLKTQFGRAPYPGTIVASFKGRLFIAAGKTLWFTEPLYPNLLFPRKDYLLFENPITMVAPVVDGLYLGTTRRTYWLNGSDPSSFRQNLTQSHGVIKGTHTNIPGDWFVTEQVWANQGYAAFWRDTEGVPCVGRLEGFVQRINAQQIKLSGFDEGASTVVKRDGLHQILTSLWGASDNAIAFGDSVTAEVVSNSLT